MTAEEGDALTEVPDAEGELAHPASEISAHLVPPRWLEVGALASVVAIASLSTVGVLLAMLGMFRWWLNVLVALGAVVAFLWVIGQIGSGSKAERTGPATHGAAVLSRAGALLLVSACLGGWFVSVQSEHVLIDRDPASYNNTAKWMADNGNLRVESPRDGFEADDLGGVEGLAVTETPEGLEFQFSHLSSAVLATSYGLLGENLMFRTTGLLMTMGLVVFGLVCWRIGRGHPIFLVGPLVLGLSMPVLYVARDSYSEPLTFLLLLGGLYATWMALEDHSRALWITSGAVLGAAVGSRPDSLLFLPGLVVLAAAAVGSQRMRGRELMLVVGGGVPPLVIGLLNPSMFSRAYWAALEDKRLQSMMLVSGALVVSAAAVLAVRRIPSLGGWIHQRRAGIAWLVAGVTGLVLAALAISPDWLIPALPPGNGIVTSLASREGLPPEAAELFRTDTVSWLSWYYGWFAVGVAGVALTMATRSLVLGKLGIEGTTILLSLAPLAVLYLWQPNITPDHPWAMRRFVPAVLPLMASMIVWGVTNFLAHLPTRRWRAAASAVAVPLLVGPALVATFPVAGMQQQAGYLTALRSACEGLPAESTVLVPDGTVSDTYMQAIRSWCGLDVIGHFEADELSEAVDAVSPGRQPAILAQNLDAAVKIAEAHPGRIVVGDIATDENRPAPTLTKVPDGYLPLDSQNYLPVIVRPTFVLVDRDGQSE